MINKGQTPALNVWVAAFPFSGGNVAKAVEDFRDRARKLKSGIYPDTVFPDDEIERPYSLMFNSEHPDIIAPTIVAIVQYKAVSDLPTDKLHQTVRVWDIVRADYPVDVLHEKMMPIPPENLKAIPNQIHPGWAD